MVKFVDGAKRFSHNEDEVCVRCVCGCDILSFGINTLYVDEENGFTNLSIVCSTTPVHKINKKDIPAYAMDFPSTEIMGTICKIISGQLNNGCGGIPSVNGAVFGIETMYGPETNELQGIKFLGFRSQKACAKYFKTGNEKLTVWEVAIDAADIEKFITALFKMFDKKHPEILDPIRKNPNNEDSSNN